MLEDGYIFARSRIAFYIIPLEIGCIVMVLLGWIGSNAKEVTGLIGSSSPRPFPLTPCCSDWKECCPFAWISSGSWTMLATAIWFFNSAWRFNSVRSLAHDRGEHKRFLLTQCKQRPRSSFGSIMHFGQQGFHWILPELHASLFDIGHIEAFLGAACSSRSGTVSMVSFAFWGWLRGIVGWFAQQFIGDPPCRSINGIVIDQVSASVHWSCFG